MFPESVEARGKPEVEVVNDVVVKTKILKVQTYSCFMFEFSRTILASKFSCDFEMHIQKNISFVDFPANGQTMMMTIKTVNIGNILR